MSGPDHKSMLLGHLTGDFSKKRVAYDVALKGKQQIAEVTMAFIFEKPKEFTFKAGQHVRVTLIDPPETDSRGNRRFFSLASAPNDRDIIFAMRMGPSAFKRTLEKMSVGAKIRIEMLIDSPHESFTLHDDSSKPAVFLIGGIGIVPAYSIVNDWAQRNLQHKLYLFYSNRRPEDAPYLKELQELAKKHPSLKLVATMTEMERSNQEWAGDTAYINQSMLKEYVGDLNSPIYYVAGLPEMVDAMREMLAKVGIESGQIHVEEFSGFKMSLKDDDEYVCPNHPQIIAAKPDQCPKCGADLVAKTPSKRSHLMPAIIALGVVGFIILHLTSVGAIHASVFSLKGPLLYLVAALLLIVIMVKIKFLLSLRHKGKSILEMHGLGRKRK